MQKSPFMFEKSQAAQIPPENGSNNVIEKCRSLRRLQERGMPFRQTGISQQGFPNAFAQRIVEFLFKQLHDYTSTYQEQEIFCQTQVPAEFVSPEFSAL